MRLLTVVLLLVLLGPPPASAAAVDAAPASTVRYEPPVPGAVLRGFADPEHAYAPGHRGVDLAADHGAPVASAAAGEVTFAGTVAGRRWVTVAHADGVRTSYGHLAAVHVATGTAVARGQVLGAATGSNGDDPLRPEPGLHWSARRGEVYLDPLSLLGGLPRPTLVGPGGWRGSHLVVQPYAPYEGGSRFAVLAPGSPTAGHRGYARAPNHHHLVQLPGYGTEGPHPVLDPGYLGYGPGDSSEFSYRGCDPTPLGCSGHPYGGTDTDLTVDDAAALLDQHLRAQQRAQPGRPVDLLGHSMGGDVATHYLTYLYDPTDPGLPPIGSLITIGTPTAAAGSATWRVPSATTPCSGTRWRRSAAWPWPSGPRAPTVSGSGPSRSRGTAPAAVVRTVTRTGSRRSVSVCSRSPDRVTSWWDVRTRGRSGRRSSSPAGTAP
ncbi:MAG: peptidoglycan DD-metalloendopeptidase family protein [Nitriliruptor sp.]|uniref:peptidoglycan DD-metalloendopeptidase family protein n=1 Tax=Nitriliruptor sp. TaxID=2448056 RepID=UPI0034A02643